MTASSVTARAVTSMSLPCRQLEHGVTSLRVFLETETKQERKRQHEKSEYHNEERFDRHDKTTATDYYRNVRVSLSVPSSLEVFS